MIQSKLTQYFIKKYCRYFRKNFVLIYTKIQRNASKIIKNIDFKSKNEILSKMVKQVESFRKIFEGKVISQTLVNF